MTLGSAADKKQVAWRERESEIEGNSLRSKMSFFSSLLLLSFSSFVRRKRASKTGCKRQFTNKCLCLFFFFLSVSLFLSSSRSERMFLLSIVKVYFSRTRQKIIYTMFCGFPLIFLILLFSRNESGANAHISESYLNTFLIALRELTTTWISLNTCGLVGKMGAKMA